MDEGDQNGAVDDREGAHGSEEFGRFKQKLVALRDSVRETPGGDPIEPDAAGLNPEDVDRLDLDGDWAISPWELERARRLVERAERHPVKNDVGDGARNSLRWGPNFSVDWTHCAAVIYLGGALRPR